MTEELNPTPYSEEPGKKKVTVEIGLDGTIRMVYSDDLWAFAEKIGGDMTATCRASNVEWEENYLLHNRKIKISGWVIRAAHDPSLAIRMKEYDNAVSDEVECSRDAGKELAVYEERKTAIAVELKFFHELLPPPKKIEEP